MRVLSHRARQSRTRDKLGSCRGLFESHLWYLAAVCSCGRHLHVSCLAFAAHRQKKRFCLETSLTSKFRNRCNLSAVWLISVVLVYQLDRLEMTWVCVASPFQMPNWVNVNWKTDHLSSKSTPFVRCSSYRLIPFAPLVVHVPCPLGAFANAACLMSFWSVLHEDWAFRTCESKF